MPFLILFNNFVGLFSYIFTPTRHLKVTLKLTVPLWISFIMYAWVKETTNTLAHLVPLETPVPLIPFIEVIEIIRNIIRPTKLSVRLAANMIAGHLLLTLLGAQGTIEKVYITAIVVFSQNFLIDTRIICGYYSILCFNDFNNSLRKRIMNQ